MTSINYVPFAQGDVPKPSTSGKKAKIHYVPHSPADLDRFVPEDDNSRRPLPPRLIIPSLLVTSPPTPPVPEEEGRMVPSTTNDAPETLGVSCGMENGAWDACACVCVVCLCVCAVHHNPRKDTL